MSNAPVSASNVFNGSSNDRNSTASGGSGQPSVISTKQQLLSSGLPRLAASSSSRIGLHEDYVLVPRSKFREMAPSSATLACDSSATTAHGGPVCDYSLFNDGDVKRSTDDCVSGIDTSSHVASVGDSSKDGEGIGPYSSHFLTGAFAKLLKDGTQQQKDLIKEIAQLAAVLSRSADSFGSLELKYVYIGSAMGTLNATTGYSIANYRGLGVSLFSAITAGTAHNNRIGNVVRIKAVKLRIQYYSNVLTSVPVGASVGTRAYPVRFFMWRTRITLFTPMPICDISNPGTQVPSTDGCITYDPFDVPLRTGNDLSQDTTVASYYSRNGMSRLNNHVYHDRVIQPLQSGDAGQTGYQDTPAAVTGYGITGQRATKWHEFSVRYPGKGLEVTWTNNAIPDTNAVWVGSVTDCPQASANPALFQPWLIQYNYTAEIFYTDA